MSKDDPKGGLLSKVARFVLHPTVNWSELDGPLPGTGSDQDRRVMRAAIERKRRNDFVRKREFDMLREALRQRQERAAGQIGGGASSVFPHSDSGGSGHSARKERTIEKIARIEAQMSHNWHRRRPGEEPEPRERLHIAGRGPAQHGPTSGVTVAGHLEQQPFGGSWSEVADSVQARRSPQPAASPNPLAIDMLPMAGVDVSSRPPLAPEGPAVAAGAQVSVVEEAALRFANGDDVAAEQALRAAMAQSADSKAGRFVWLSLLDFHHARGDVENFEETAVEFNELFGGKVPRWPGYDGGSSGRYAGSITVRNQPEQDSAAGLTHAAREDGGTPAVWTCPVLLDVAAVDAAHAAMVGQHSQRWLDWSALVSADALAAQALLDRVREWTTWPVEFRFAGGGVLRRRLKASTPSGRRENNPLWWHLRLEMLRLMHRQEEFDLVALDFCVTYGVLPPDWVVSANRFRLADTLPVGAALAQAPTELAALATELGPFDTMAWPSVVSDTELMPHPPLDAASTMPMTRSPDTGAPTQIPGGSGRAVLRGALRGDIAAQIRQLQQTLAKHPSDTPFQVECAHLSRIDFVAAGNLLQWLLGLSARGQKVELVHVHRLIAAFLHVVGIDDSVVVRLREY